MPVGGILMMILGFVGVVFLIGINISKTQQENQRKKNEQIETKIKLQPFILAAKSIFPDYKLKLYDRAAVLEGYLVNDNNKNVGNVEIHGYRSLSYDNVPTYLVHLEITILDKKYQVRKEHLQENFEILKGTIFELKNELMENQDLKKKNYCYNLLIVNKIFLCLIITIVFMFSK